MLKPSVLVANERVKAAASLLFNSGGALLAATIVKLYNEPTVDWPVVVWASGAAFFMYVGWLTFLLLEPEE